VPAILDLVAAGYGHAILTRTALAAFGQPGAFSLRPLSQARPLQHPVPRRLGAQAGTPLGKRAMRLLQELVLSESLDAAAHNKTR
jgi:LysR family nitrogen assimilation transcriptional regulator